MAEKLRSRVAAAVIPLALAASACSVPSLSHERRIATALPQTSFLYAADGTLITALHAGEDRVIVSTKEMPRVIRNAVIASEDQRFYQHSGIDLRALLRAAYVDATEGRIVEGGSTITQQLVKNLYVGNADTLTRKVKEAVLAWQLEHKLTKQQILTKYLNTVYLGEGAYGIEAAAQTYFDEPATDLSLAQSALLAGLIRAPVDYDPFSHPTHARQRRNHVLELMAAQGMIGAATRQRASRRPIQLDPGNENEKRYIGPYFVDYFKQWFLSNPRFGETPQDRYDLLFKGGLRITTTLDPKLQEDAERAVHTVLPYPSDPYAAMTVIDPRTGWVRAMVGGRNYWDDGDRFAKINLATGGSTGRQTGSAFKPFALVAALENGFTPNSPLNGSFAKIPLQDGTYWEPKNSEGTGAGTVSLTTATVDSINIAYANLELQLGDGDAYEGARKIVETARRMGIRCCPTTSEPTTPLVAMPSAVLGANEVSSLEMASGFGTLAQAGQHVQPTPVITITKADGTLLYRSMPRPRSVVSPAVVSIADEILQKVVQYGTGTAANIGRPQIGKTGTNSDFTDAWFVGAVPQLVTAVWVGFPQGQIPMCCGRVRISEVFGGTWPAQIWHAFMAAATAKLPVRDFPTVQAEYVTLRVDVTQGCLANPFTPPQHIRTFQYISGTQPKMKVCKQPTSYQELPVPSVIGLDQAEATTRLHGAGFDVSVRYASSDRAEGTVIDQDPAAGEGLVQSGTVTITVAKGPPTRTVPNVIGMTEAAAVATLQDAGFAVTVVKDRGCTPNEPGCHYRKGVVWAQDPAGGSQADRGSTVTITVNP